MLNFLEVTRHGLFCGTKLHHRYNGGSFTLRLKAPVVKESNEEDSVLTLRTVSKMPAQSTCHRNKLTESAKTKLQLYLVICR